jgi:hypothetical protein
VTASTRCKSWSNVVTAETEAFEIGERGGDLVARLQLSRLSPIRRPEVSVPLAEVLVEPREHFPGHPGALFGNIVGRVEQYNLLVGGPGAEHAKEGVFAEKNPIEPAGDQQSRGLQPRREVCLVRSFQGLLEIEAAIEHDDGFEPGFDRGPNERILTQLAAAFAVLATALAMLGLYGVMAHGVARRTREIGIRMAVGASPGTIRRMVMREMLWMLGGGLAVGVPAALELARYTKSQLYGVETSDAMVVACASAALAVTAAAAAYIPARRASRITPIRALRYD